MSIFYKNGEKMTQRQGVQSAQRRLAGLRIRERRREIGMKQIDLAAKIGVSPAYLNLIEGNKRPIGGAILLRISEELEISIDQLDGTTERRLREELTELAAETETSRAKGGPGEPDEFIARFPAWARATAGLHRRWREAVAETESMSDRLAHDPALGAAIHDMLTEIAALRSTAEILSEGREITGPQRRRFEQSMFDLSSQLAETGAGLAAYFDNVAETRRLALPSDAAEDALEANPATNEAIENLATTVRQKLAGDDLEAALRRKTDKLPEISIAANRAERLTRLANAHVANSYRQAIFDIAEPIAPGEHEEADTVLSLIQHELTMRLADAVLQPAEKLIALCEEVKWDIGTVIQALDDDAALVMRRIACLGEAGAPRSAHVAIDASGHVLSRRGALDLLPRSRRLDCPVWPALRTEGTGTLLGMQLELADGAQVLAIAVRRRTRMAIDMLVIDPNSTRELVYKGQGKSQTESAGSDCRVCIHSECRWRREAAIIG